MKRERYWLLISKYYVLWSNIHDQKVGQRNLIGKRALLQVYWRMMIEKDQVSYLEKGDQDNPLFPPKIEMVERGFLFIFSGILVSSQRMKWKAYYYWVVPWKSHAWPPKNPRYAFRFFFSTFLFVRKIKKEKKCLISRIVLHSW